MYDVCTYARMYVCTDLRFTYVRMYVILKILRKIALPCGASSKFHGFFVQNRTSVRSILKILNRIALPSWAV